MTIKRHTAAALWPWLILPTLNLLIYGLVFVRPFPLHQFYQLIPPLDYTKLSGYSVSAFVAYVLAVITLFAIYGYALKQPQRPGWLPYSGLFSAAILFFSYPVLAIDLFAYAVRSRGWGLYGLNPLAGAPADLPTTDPWVGLAAQWQDAASPYGPLWEILSLVGVPLADGNFLFQLFFLKGLAIGGYLLSIWLLGAVLAIIHPALKSTAMLAFAWNPLVLLETAQNGHNDILMVALLLAAVWLLVKGWAWGAMIVIGLAAQIKIIPVLVMPFWLWHLASQGQTLQVQIKRTLRYGLILVAVIVIPLWPVFPGWDQWAVLQASHGAGRSLTALLILALQPLIGLSTAFDAGRMIANSLFVGLTALAAWRHRKTIDQFDTLFQLTWFAFFWYALLAAPVFHGWYLLWSLPFALLTPHRRLWRISLVATATALLIMPYWETVRVWYPILLSNPLRGHTIGVIVLLIPALAAALWPVGKNGTKSASMV